MNCTNLAMFSGCSIGSPLTASSSAPLPTPTTVRSKSAVRVLAFSRKGCRCSCRRSLRVPLAATPSPKPSRKAGGTLEGVGLGDMARSMAGIRSSDLKGLRTTPTAPAAVA